MVCKSLFSVMAVSYTHLNWSQIVTSPCYYSNIAKSPKIYDYGFADYPKQDF